MNKKTTLVHLGIIGSLGLAIGLLGWVLFPRIPVWSDSLSYFTVAMNLLAGKGLVSSYVGPNEAFIMGLPCPDLHMPGWPLLIAGFMWLTRTGLYAPVILNIVLTIFSAVLFYFTVSAWSDRTRALTGSLFFLFFPLTLAYEFTALAEISLVFWSILAVFLASVASPKRTLMWLIAIGLAYTAGFCTRQTAIFLLPLISLTLAERGFSRIIAICFGIALALVSALAHLAYSSVDSLHEAQNLLFRYDLLLHTGLLSGSFYREILTGADLSSGIPLPELLWAILVKKPVRMLASYLSPDRIWQAETMMKLLVIAILAVGPFLVRLKRIRWGLLSFLLLILMALWLYRFEARQFFAFTVINLAFVFALSRSIPRIRWLVLLFLSMLTSSVFYTLEVQGGRSAVYNSEAKSARVVAELLPKGAKVAAGWPTTMVLYRPDISVVTLPATMEDLTLLEQEVKLDAVVLSSQEKGIVQWGWEEDTLFVENEVMYLYRRPR